MDFDKLFGIDANASDKARSYERESGFRQTALHIGELLARGEISRDLD